MISRSFPTAFLLLSLCKQALADKFQLWDPQTGPLYQDVQQKDWGDCWLDAAISSMAHANQDYLKKMIKPDPKDENNAVVYLWHKGGMQTIVTGINPQENHSSSNIYMWPAAIEQALLGMGTHFPDLKVPDNLGGGSFPLAFRAMYDMHSFIFQDIPTNTKTKDADAKFWSIWNKARDDPTVSELNGENDVGLPSGHAYSALRCDQGAGIVTLRNPWGVVSQHDDKLAKEIVVHENGVFDMPYRLWKEVFGGLASVRPFPKMKNGRVGRI